MASRCNRFMNKASISNLKSAFMPKSPSSSPKFPLPSRSTASPLPRFSVSRCPSELGCVQSLLPLHNAVAAARLTSCLSTTSRSCRSLSQASCFGASFNRTCMWHMICHCMKEMNWDLQSLSSYQSLVCRFQGDMLADIWTEKRYLLEQEARFRNSSQLFCSS
ncbi:hypothetical protein QVD17_28212 [Tagetes erecta]|uniref:Uncharacterized protein n=1 Tax=Tagetes erecta TaxID=13708 RepID=A0AAD8NKA1_TARER|nr:hypothetical protein QVD17_28212 [Tagetes erecta]